MSHKKISLLFLSSVLLIVMPSCSRAPKDLPKLVPASIVVLDNGKPIDEVQVAITLKSGQGGWTVNGTTDKSGRAVMKTVYGSYEKKGAPAGSYSVRLIKEPFLPETLSDEEYKKLSLDEQMAYKENRAVEIRSLPREIPIEFSMPNTSPVEIAIGEKGGEETVDISSFKL
ncbi:MAG: carboxypeptidase-like regulatory domain-containing protein [Thermoguttaceae bacterium]